MNQRTIMIMAAVLGLLVLIIFIGQRTDQAPGIGPAGLLIPALSDRLDDVNSVTITAAGGSVAATLTRGEAGWVVVERSNYPANVTRLRAGLLALAQAQRIEQKTSNPGFYDRLGVESVEDEDANGVLVSIGGLGDQPVQVIVGDAAGSDYRYVRLNDEATSWLIDRDPDFPRVTGEWLVADLFDIDSDRIQSISVNHPNGERLEVTKTTPDQADFSVANIPTGRELLYTGVANAMGDVLEKLVLEDVEPTGTDSDAAATITEFRAFDGLVITATAEERDDSVWVSFAARFDPALAEAFTVVDSDPEVTADDASPPAAQDAPGDVSGKLDVAAEAEQINGKLAGWRYQISQFKFEQMTRSMDDLLQALPNDDG